jgi:hypothetical protein
MFKLTISPFTFIQRHDKLSIFVTLANKSVRLAVLSLWNSELSRPRVRDEAGLVRLCQNWVKSNRSITYES